MSSRAKLDRRVKELQRKHGAECIVAFRLGAFVDGFGDSAKAISHLFARPVIHLRRDGAQIAMCGFPAADEAECVAYVRACGRQIVVVDGTTAKGARSNVVGVPSRVARHLPMASL